MFSWIVQLSKSIFNGGGSCNFQPSLRGWVRQFCAKRGMCAVCFLSMTFPYAPVHPTPLLLKPFWPVPKLNESRFIVHCDRYHYLPHASRKHENGKWNTLLISSELRFEQDSNQWFYRQCFCHMIYQLTGIVELAVFEFKFIAIHPCMTAPRWKWLRSAVWRDCLCLA